MASVSHRSSGHNEGLMRVTTGSRTLNMAMQSKATLPRRPEIRRIMVHPEWIYSQTKSAVMLFLSVP